MLKIYKIIQTRTINILLYANVINKNLCYRQFVRYVKMGYLH